MLLACSCLGGGQEGPLTQWTLRQEGQSAEYTVTVPCTVAGALNEAGVFGADVLDEGRYAQLDRTPFDSPWTFSTRFKASKGMRHILRFDGLNFYADIRLNGRQIASPDTTYGCFAVREFDVTPLVKRNNLLEVTLRRAQDGDLNTGFVDWNPAPLDESMGITGPVTLIITPDVEVQDVYVRPFVDPENLSSARFEAKCMAVNRSDKPVEGFLQGTYEGGNFSVPVELAAGATQEITVEQTVAEPRIWWTREMGSPELYHLNVAFEKGGKVSDERKVRFGLRDIQGIVDEEGHRLFLLNGRKVLVKAGGWTDDIFLQDTPESLSAQLELVTDMGLNGIRFENIWGKDDTVYDLCDSLGILALVGWSCQWEWANYCGLPEQSPYGCINDERSEKLAVRYFHDQLVRLRNHPAVIGWLTGSDRIPNPRLEKQYLALYEALDYRPYICSASGLGSLAGPSGMKMAGPYEYVGPDYWWVDTRCGGAYGFNTETSPGLSLPQEESLRRMVGEKDLWPIGPNWAFHCTASAPHLNSPAFLEEAMGQMYGPAADLQDFIRKAHAMDYDSERAMYEAFRGNIPHSTGIVQWMLNSAWPSLYWQLYDWYGIPTAGYYGTRNACQPVQLVFNYKDYGVWVVNDAVPEASVTARLRVYDPDCRLIRDESAPLVSLAREPAKVFSGIQGPCFVALSLTGDAETENFYCIPAKGTDYDWDKADWWGITAGRYADLRFVTALPKAIVEMKADEDGFTLVNTSEVIAYQLILKAKDASGQLIPGAFWSDNFFTLLPGESRKVTCRLPEGTTADFSLQGWNI